MKMTGETDIKTLLTIGENVVIESMIKSMA